MACFRRLPALCPSYLCSGLSLAFLAVVRIRLTGDSTLSTLQGLGVLGPTPMDSRTLVALPSLKCKELALVAVAKWLELWQTVDVSVSGRWFSSPLSPLPSLSATLSEEQWKNMLVRINILFKSKE